MLDPTTLENLRYECKDGVAFVTVARPRALNALDARTLDELERVFDTVASDPAVRAAVVTGDGEKAFVAGADVAELARLSPLEAQCASARGQEVLGRVEGCGKLVVAAVNGFALGGGLELALACHVRFAAEGARLGLPEVTLGLLPGYGGTQRLARVVGTGRALELVLSGEMVDAAAAERMGLVNRVVPAGELLGAAEAYARRVAAQGPVAVRLALEAVLGGREGGLRAGLERERDLFALCFATEDMREGTRAFLEKRRPVFEGR